MEVMTIAEAAKAIGAEWHGEDVPFRGICMDTRRNTSGSLFFALRGENADGHAFVHKAFEAGCVAAVVDRPIAGASGPLLVVPDTLRALGDLACTYRNRFDIPVIGITGSVGKTSTKEMIACALGSRLRVLASEKNFNNEIGVPQTLFQLDRSHDAAVIEMGMRGAGQIAELGRIGRPTIGVITNIGITHIELLGSREAIARAKGELIEALPANGTAVIPADDDFAPMLREIAGPRRVITFGLQHNADFHVTDVTWNPDGSSQFKVNSQSFAIAAPGVHHLTNAAAVCAVASIVGIPLDTVAAQLARFRAPSMRMETVQGRDGITILNDAYNAAPDSMRAALQTLSLLSGGRRTVAILGDMREMGDHSAEAHRYVGELAAGLDVDLLVTVGAEAKRIADAATEGLGIERIARFEDTKTAVAEVGQFLRDGDLVLVKGSRAMEMERIVEVLKAEQPV